MPEWARKTLADHADDPRPYTYTRDQFEAAKTHDPYWNAAMREMLATGYMHNHLRMFGARSSTGRPRRRRRLRRSWP